MTDEHRRARTVTTYYQATDRSPLSGRTLLVGSTGTDLNTRVLSEVAPSFQGDLASGTRAAREGAADPARRT